MIITQIEPIGKSKAKVYLEGEFAFVLYKGELRRFRMQEEGELPDEIYIEIMTEVLPKRATLRAMNLLQTKFYAKRELERKLQEGGYPESAILKAMDYVISYGYIDDVRLAEDYIRYHVQGKSRSVISQNLTKKGISSQDQETAWSHCEDLGISVDTMGQIQTLIQKKHFDAEHATRPELQKIYGFLMRRGYSFVEIRQALRGATPDGEEY